MQPGDTVWLRDQQLYGQVIQKTNEPRSYLIKTSHGTTVRRNRSAIVFTGKEQLSAGELQKQTEHQTSQQVQRLRHEITLQSKTKL